MHPDEVRARISYDPGTGVLTSKITGKPVGCVNHWGYRIIRLGEHQHPASHVAHVCMVGEWPAEQMDHINHSRADDRWENLRPATQAENLRNRKVQRNNKAGLKGVFWCSRSDSWRANISRGGRAYCLGKFSSAEQAHAAYCQAAKEEYGEFAYSG